MIGVILATSFMGISIVLIAWTLVKMFCRWAFAGQKTEEPKGTQTYANLETEWSKALLKFKEMEINNQLNDN